MLQYMHLPGMSLSVNDAASLMIILSDNIGDEDVMLDRIAIQTRVVEDGSARSPSAHTEGALERLSCG